MTAVLRPSRCAVCGIEGNAHELYPATISAEDLNPETFSARRLPDRAHYRMVRCTRCGLVRSDPVADPDLLGPLYRSSGFDYQAEIPNLVRTYGGYLRQVAGLRREPSALLEIGCGNGFMLEEALRLGFVSVMGVEPSLAAVEQASPDVRPFLVCDVLREGLIEPERFDVVCLFQVLDHLPDPGAALDLCRESLKPGGCLLILNHNVAAWSERVLRSRSPIIDVEHTYLYDPATLTALCRAHDLEVQDVGRARNWCSLEYLAHLLPLPLGVKRPLLRVLGGSRFGRLSAQVPLGNLYLIAEKTAR